MQSTQERKVYPTAVQSRPAAQASCGLLRNEHHGRLEYTSIRGEFCWVFVPRPVSP